MCSAALQHPRQKIVIQEVCKQKVQDYVFVVYDLVFPSLKVLCCTATPKAETVIQQVSKQVLEVICVESL